MTMNSIAYHQRLRIARATLVLAIFAALLAWVLPFDVAADGILGGFVTSEVEYMRHTSSLLRVTYFALLKLLPTGPYSGYAGVNVANYVAVVLLSLNLMAAPFCVVWIPRANLMKWLWIVVDIGVVVALIHGWGQSEYWSATAIGVGGVSTSIHLRFLPGFYLACFATLLHFTGLFLIPSAKSLDRPALPASE